VAGFFVFLRQLYGDQAAQYRDPVSLGGRFVTSASRNPRKAHRQPRLCRRESCLESNAPRPTPVEGVGRGARIIGDQLELALRERI